MTRWLTIAVLLAATPAAASETRQANAHALIVGSNRGGPGQAELRFAHRDAEQVALVLRELSDYPPAQIEVLEDPTPAELEAAFDRLSARLAVAAVADEPSQLFFYYSGHARAHALNLGEGLVPLDELRARLTAIPATLTIAVLDACQSGAISRVKGATPAEDFSFNSMSQLSAAGLAVMASSTAHELSQESDELRGSFFSHHLVAALRGAGDTDLDGRITLAEAYRYAYNQTLVATTPTAVGGQHVTLETNLRGKGELVLSHPARADAHLELPEALNGKVVIYQAGGGSVLAELHKAAGLPMQIALPAGEYVALVRTGPETRRCAFVLDSSASVVLALDGCQAAVADAAAKGEAPAVEQSWEKAVVYMDQRRSPAAAAWLAAIPVPGGLGHFYNDDYWSQGLFFTTIEAGELVAFAALYSHWMRRSDRLRSTLMNQYGVQPVATTGLLPEEPDKAAVLLGMGLIFIATKVWEAADAYARVAAYNDALRRELRQTPSPSVRLVPVVEPGPYGTAWGGRAVLSF